MATLIPAYSSCASRMTSGERRLAQRLEAKLDDDYLCWYDVPIGTRHLHPDFVVLHPNRGFLVLEVKDWKLENIIEIDRDRVVLATDAGRVVKANPMRQARDYTVQIASTLQKDRALVHLDGHRHAGRLVMPWGFGVVLANISRQQFVEAELGNFMNPANTVCRDEMTEAVDPEAFQKHLWDMFFVPFPCTLTLPQVDRFRWHLFPQLRIQPPGQVDMFGSDRQIAADVEIPDLIRVMDLQQEQLARSMGDGHRVIHGVAGSGKTMILGYRCIELARRYAKPILVLCFNKTLAGRLEGMLAAHGTSENVSVYHFHGWCGEQLRTYGLTRPYRFDEQVHALMQAVDDSIVPRAQYAAVLIDEGQDFAPEWLRLVVQMVDPETNSFLLLFDDAQNVYDNGGKRRFTFKSVGIQVQGGGRSTILRLNYRNTLEVLATAKAFADELLSARDDDEDHPIIAPESAGRRGPLPELIRCRNSMDEMDTIRDIVAAQLNDGISANDMAVLCHSGYAAQRMAEHLQHAGLPVKLADDRNKRTLFEGMPSVKVLTLHSSKGLEFDTVFIHQLNKVGAHASADDNIDHDARLLYVAMTRSLRKLTLLCHGDGPFTGKLDQALAQTRLRLVA